MNRKIMYGLHDEKSTSESDSDNEVKYVNKRHLEKPYRI